MFKSLSALVAATAIAAGTLGLTASAEAGWKDRIKNYADKIEFNGNKCSGRLGKYLKSCGSSKTLAVPAVKLKKGKLGKLKAAKVGKGKLGKLKSTKIGKGGITSKLSKGKGKLGSVKSLAKVKSGKKGGKVAALSAGKKPSLKSKALKKSNLSVPKKLKKNSGSVKTMLKDIVGKKIGGKKEGCKRYIPAAGLTVTVPCGL